MIDWLTIKLARDRVRPEDWTRMVERFGSMIAVRAGGVKTGTTAMVTGPDGTVIRCGDVEWLQVRRESVRSDSHVVQVMAGYDLEISGSPARVRSGHNTFGSGDPSQCAREMIGFVSSLLGVSLPADVSAYRVTRIDVTHNYDLGSATEVRQALACLRQADSGYYRVRTAGESVYWNQGSAVRSGKAYHKGPHLEYMRKGNRCEVTDAEIALAQRLLRLELSLRGQFFRERADRRWFEYSEADLEEMHREYFEKFIGKVEVVEMGSLREQVVAAAVAMGKTPGRGLSAYRTLTLIRAVGVREARESMGKCTWFHHVQLLKAAGLTDADFHAGNILPFRRRSIELGAPVRSFAEMLERAA